MNITKAIIPVAGYGTRWLPMTKVIDKSMLPIGTRPLVDYAVADAIAAGAKDIYIVSGTGNSQVEQYYKPNPILETYLNERGKTDAIKLLQTAPADVNFHFMVQQDINKYYGTAVPVAQVIEKFFDGKVDEPVMVLMGDDFVYRSDGGSEMADLIADMGSTSDCAMLVEEIPRQNVSRYGVVDIDDDGNLRNFVEKPSVEEAPSNLINISKYVFSPALLRKISDYVSSNSFGADEQEYLITDPILDYVRTGGKIKVRRTVGKYLDGGTPEGWMIANREVFAD